MLALCASAVTWLAPQALAQSPPGALPVTADDVVAYALENNLQLKEARFYPRIADQDVDAAAGSWTPELSTRVASVGSQAPSATTFDAAQSSIVDRQLFSDTAWAQRLPWGTAYQLSWTGARRSSNSAFVRFDPELQAGVTAAVTQPLLKGLRFDAARAEHRTSLQGRAIADASVAAAVASTTREVRHAYWNWVYAIDYLAVQHQSLQMAQTLLDGNRARVAVGALAAVDVIEAEAEVARRSESIAIAEKNVANTEDVVRTLAFDLDDPRSPGSLAPSIIEPAPLQTGGAVERALTNP